MLVFWFFSQPQPLGCFHSMPFSEILSSCVLSTGERYCTDGSNAKTNISLGIRIFLFFSFLIFSTYVMTIEILN